MNQAVSAPLPLLSEHSMNVLPSVILAVLKSILDQRFQYHPRRMKQADQLHFQAVVDA